MERSGFRENKIDRFDDYLKKSKIFEKISEIDPYEEEFWNDDEMIKKGNMVKCIQTCITQGIRINENEIYEIVKMSDPCTIARLSYENGFLQIKGKADLIKKDFYNYYGRNEILDGFESNNEIIRYEGVIPIWWPNHVFIFSKLNESLTNIEIDPFDEEI
jgi:hypothetical protein